MVKKKCIRAREIRRLRLGAAKVKTAVVKQAVAEREGGGAGEREWMRTWWAI